MEMIVKVMKAFENCIRTPKCLDCHWETCEEPDCETVEIPRNLACTVFAMLKAQEPRVLTLEEVRSACKTPMLFESKGTFRGEKCFWCLNLGVSPSFHVRLMPAIGEQSTELSLAVYGKVWRCWTAKPTPEQREAIPWN